MDKPGRATLVGGATGGVFVDDATVRGLITFVIQGLRRRAIAPQEAPAAGLTRDELATRSFVSILGSGWRGSEEPRSEMRMATALA